jgi:AcrR family transcriptional regulator
MMEHSHATTEEEKEKLRISETIIKVGIKLFREKDYFAISMEEVIEQSELSKEVVLAFFPTQEKLFIEILIREYYMWFAYELDLIGKMPELSLEEYRGHLLLTTGVMMDTRDMLIQLMSMKKWVFEKALDKASIARVDKILVTNLKKFATNTVGKVAALNFEEIFDIYKTICTLLIGGNQLSYQVDAAQDLTVENHQEMTKSAYKKLVINLLDQYLNGVFSKKNLEV